MAVVVEEDVQAAMAAEEDVVAVDVAVAEETSAVRKPNTGTNRKRVSTRNVRTHLLALRACIASLIRRFS